MEFVTSDHTFKKHTREKNCNPMKLRELFCCFSVEMHRTVKDEKHQVVYITALQR